MATLGLRLSREEVAHASPHSREAGFVVVAALALVPLLFGVCVAVSTVVTTLQRRAEAQALCMRQATLLADELGRHLRQLTALNARARTLRRSLEAAEKARSISALAGPEAVAAAEALVLAVRLMRATLAARQKSILARAELARLRHGRAFVSVAVGLHAKRSRLRVGNVRALAVEARPAGDVAPEYVSVKDFARRQEVTGSLVISIESNVAGWGALDHEMACKVTNEREERNWKPKIVAANARSRWPWWPSH